MFYIENYIVIVLYVIIDENINIVSYIIKVLSVFNFRVEKLPFCAETPVKNLL